MYRTITKKIFWEFDSIIMQNLSDILPLFCTPTWPSYHVSENQEYSRFYLSYSHDNELIQLIVIYPLYTTNQRLNNCQMTVESKHAIAFVTIGDW